MKKPMAKAGTCFAAAVFVASAVMTMTPGITLAQTRITCAYANDDRDYVSGANTIDGYMVTTASQIYLPPVLTGGDSNGGGVMSDIVISPAKDILYAADSHSGDIAAMKINPTDCQLTLVGNFPVGPDAGLGMGLAISPNGKWLYVAEVESEKLDVLAIRANGTLTEVKQTMTLPNRPSNLVVSADSTILIVGIPARPKNGDEAVSYGINPSTGMLTQVSIALTAGPPGGIAIDSQGKFVYVNEIGYAQQVRVGLLEIEPGGTLTFLRTYNFTEVMGSFSTSAAILSANGKYLYVTNPDIAALTTLEVNSVTGALRYATTTPDGTVDSDSPTGLATTNNGAFIFTGDYAHGETPYMGIFAVGTGGSLTSLGTFPLAQGEFNIYPEWVAARNF